MENTVAVEQAQTQRVSRWEDFIDVFMSPAELFRRRANTSWAVPMVVVAVLSTVLYFAFMPVNRAFMEAQAAAVAADNPQAAAAMQNTTGIQAIFGGAVMPIAMTLFVVFGAFVTWLTTKVTSVDLTWRKALMINAYLMMLAVVQTVAVYIAGLLKVNRGESLHMLTDRSTGVIRFMQVDEMNKAVLALLTRVDIFAFWTLVWTAIALAAVTNVSKEKAWLTAGIIWFAMAVPALIGSFFM